MDRLQSLKVFVEVADCESFIAAARKLGISRPMVSKHVQELENELGVRLFNRTTRQVSLTEAGAAFKFRCDTILAELTDAVAEAGQAQVEPSGLLRINAPLTFGRAHLVPAITAFQSVHPDIRIDLTLNDRTVDIVDEGFDLAIRIGSLTDSSLLARKLAPCQMVLCASPQYLTQAPELDEPEDLASHNCLIYAYFQQEKTWTFDGPQGEAAIKVDGDFRTNFGEALVEAALQGRGIVLEPSFTVHRHLKSGRLVRLLPDHAPRELGIYAVYPPSRMLPQKVRSFIDHLADRLRPEPYWDDVGPD